MSLCVDFGTAAFLASTTASTSTVAHDTKTSGSGRRKGSTEIFASDKKTDANRSEEATVRPGQASEMEMEAFPGPNVP